MPFLILLPKKLELGEQGWKIAFCPYLDLLKTGNDPVRMFRELAELGDLYNISLIPRIFLVFMNWIQRNVIFPGHLKVVGDIPAMKSRKFLTGLKATVNWKSSRLLKRLKSPLL